MGCGGSKTPQAALPPPKLYAFRIKVLGGLNLYNNEFGMQLPGTKTSKYKFDCRPNPSVEMSCEDQKYSTSHKFLETNPVWNEEFIFTCNSRKPLLKLRVYDRVHLTDIGKAASGQSSVIGEADINLHGLLGKGEREMWVQLKGTRGKGELGVLVQECYRTEVKVIAGHDLLAVDKFTKTSDVYMTLQVGQQPKQKTSVQKWTLNPRWGGELFYFYIPHDPVECMLQCMLWDKDITGMDDSMGWVHYNFNTKGVERDPASGQIKATTIKLKVSGAKAGEIELLVGNPNPYKPEAADPGPVPEAQKALWPPIAPQTVSFEVKVLGAFNLAAGDPKVVTNWIDDVKNELIYQEFRPPAASSDPFARIECEGMVYDTTKVNNTIHPVWNETMRLVCRNKDEAQIKVSVFDHDVVSPNDCLGSMTLPCTLMQSGQYIEVWGYLDNGARGEVGLLLTQAFQVKCRVRNAVDLPAADLNGMSDPYVRVGIEGKWYETRVVKNDRNPLFFEDFRWCVTSINEDTFLDVEVWDSDFKLFNDKKVAGDFLGRGKVALSGLKRGIPNDFAVALTNEGKPAGTVNLYVLDEMPIPPTVLAELEKVGKEAFNVARQQYASAAKEVFKIIKPQSEEEEEIIEPADPKTNIRPRYSRMRCTILGCRGLKKKAQTNVYVTMEVPLQGHRAKTATSTDIENPDFNQEFDFDVPTKTNGGLRFYIMDGSLVQYTADWNPEDAKKALYTIDLPFKSLNGGKGLIRGSPSDDLWIPIQEGGQTVGELVVRVEEDYRFEFFVRHIRMENPASQTDDLPVNMSIQVVGSNLPKLNVHETIVQKQETFALIRESFTVFTRTKNNLTLEVDAGTWGKGTCELQSLRRGVEHVVDVKLNGPQGGIVQLFLMEEEKKGLMDQVIDIAKNAAKLAARGVQELANAAKNAMEKVNVDSAKDMAKDIAGNVTGALGGMFGKK